LGNILTFLPGGTFSKEEHFALGRRFFREEDDFLPVFGKEEEKKTLWFNVVFERQFRGEM